MHLTQREQEQLMIYTASELARKRQARGLKLNYPEAMAILSAEIMEAARAGQSVANIITYGTTILRRDNLAASFSPASVERWIYVIGVAGGDKVPRKGAPGIMRSGLLVINIDLAPHVGASLDVLDRDARLMRGEQPFVFTNLKNETGLNTVVDWLETQIHTPRPDPPAWAADGKHDHHHEHSHSH